MPFNYNNGIGIKNNPLTSSVFVIEFSGQGDFPPPTSSFRITDSSEQRITDGGDNRITD